MMREINETRGVGAAGGSLLAPWSLPGGVGAPRAPWRIGDTVAPGFDNCEKDGEGVAKSMSGALQKTLRKGLQKRGDEHGESIARA